MPGTKLGIYNTKRNQRSAIIPGIVKKPELFFGLPKILPPRYIGFYCENATGGHIINPDLISKLIHQIGNAGVMGADSKMIKLVGRFFYYIVKCIRCREV